MSHRGWLGGLAASIGLLAMLAGGQAAAASQDLVILHDNDIHGHQIGRAHV